MSIFDFIISHKSKHKYHKTKIHQHGHRCYTEGLDHNEQALVSYMAQNLDAKEYFIFNNLTIPSSSTISAQIDHVIVSRYGIFVIESKNYNGYIFGSRDKKGWTATYKGGYKFPFQNPILQNFSHVSALKEQFPFLGKCFFNIVVFNGNCEFKTERIPNVLYVNELIECISEKKHKYLKDDEVCLVVGKLLVLCQNNNIDLKEHIENLHVHHLNKSKRH